MADDPNNSQEAADNTVQHVANAADAYSKGDVHTAVVETGKAIQSSAQGWAHILNGN